MLIHKKSKNPIKISVIGCGYVGLVTGIGFAELSHNVIFVDIDDEKISEINSATPPIFEKNLDVLLEKNRDRYFATDNYREAIYNTDMSFVCVGTPSSNDGAIDLSQIKAVAKNIGEALKKDSFHSVVIKSTILPGTTESVVKPIIENISKKNAYNDFGLAVNPEFLREGNAVHDFFNPDRIVVGTQDKISKEILNELYSPFNCPKLFTNIKTAEMIKYTSNAFLATKISFANEIENICKKIGIDVYDVFEGVGLDHRINPAFFSAGIGFGGSCFPKDIMAFIKWSLDEYGSEVQLIDALKIMSKKDSVYGLNG